MTESIDRTIESVWDYPRPPAVLRDDRLVRVECGGHVIAETRRALRVLETSHPPTFYVPPEDVRSDLLFPNNGHSWCEWKGTARYWDLIIGHEVRGRAAWSYSNPEPAYTALRDCFAFYVGRVGRCLVGGEEARAQDGDFYGGWITSDVQGPFKGALKTRGW
ncbi:MULTISPECIES: DUF427 domain-containing protein [unclassified Streptomyces]|jgi:Uncharacterized protein conserved in bacteria|uniref:DUF427 domain-containing protein n=1 Tax=unclassified Streptomyces TaxID=2593676 RepID=UPI002E26944C